jgi:hypothetical protein
VCRNHFHVYVANYLRDFDSSPCSSLLSAVIWWCHLSLRLLEKDYQSLRRTVSFLFPRYSIAHDHEVVTEVINRASLLRVLPPLRAVRLLSPSLRSPYLFTRAKPVYLRVCWPSGVRKVRCSGRIGSRWSFRTGS